MIIKGQGAITGWFEMQPGPLFMLGNDRFTIDLAKTDTQLIATTRDYVHTTDDAPSTWTLTYDAANGGWNMVTLDWSDGLTLFYNTDQVAQDDSIQVAFDDDDTNKIVVGGNFDDKTPTVVDLTNLATNPAMVNTSGTLKIKTNLALHPIGSSVAATTGWAPARMAAAVGAGFLTGTVNDNSATQYWRNTDYITCTPGDSITASMDLRNSSGMSMYAWIQWYDSTSTYLSLTRGTTLAPGDSGWHRLSVAGTAPANAVKYQVLGGLDGQIMPVGGTLDVRRLSAGLGSDYFDGNGRGRVNKIADPSFASGDGGFVPVVNRATTEWSDEHSRVGTHSLKITTIGLSAAAYIKLPDILPSTTYTMSAWYYIPPTNTPAGGSYYAIRVAGTSVTPTSSSPATVGVGWQQIQLTFTTNSTATPAAYLYCYGSSVNGESVWVDDIGVAEGTLPALPPKYGDDFTYAWTGTVGGSTSTMSGKAVASFAGAVSYAIASNVWSESGTQSIRHIPNYVNQGSAYIDLARDTGGLTTLVRGKTYTAMATCHIEDPIVGSTVTPGIQWSVSGMTDETLKANTDTTSGTYYLRVVFTVPTDAAATGWRVRLYNNQPVGGQDCWWDNVVLCEGAYYGDYFDGSTTPSGGHVYAWSGTANASTTLRYSSANVYYGAADQVAYVDRQVTLDDVIDFYSHGVADVDARLLYDGTIVASADGTWMQAFTLADYETIEGSKIEWTGNNAVVSTSFDGDNWTTVNSGDAVPGLTTTTDVSTTTLFVKIELNSTNTAAFVNNLSIKLYKYRTILGTESDRPITLSSQVPLAPGEFGIVERADNAGAQIPGAVLAKDFSTPQLPIRAVEFWVNRIYGLRYLFDERWASGSSGGYMTNAATFVGVDSVYVDGILATSPANIPPGEWHLVTINLSDDSLVPLRFNDDSSTRTETLVDTNQILNPRVDLDSSGYSGTDIRMSDESIDGDSSVSLPLAGESTQTLTASGFTTTGGILNFSFLAPDVAAVAVTINGTIYSQEVTPGDWTTVEIPLTGTVTSFAVTAAVNPALTDDTVFDDDDELLVDQVSITSGGEYFDGNTARTNYLFNWTGDPGNSTSTKTIYASTPSPVLNRFKEIAYYRDVITPEEALQHYELNVGKPALAADDESIAQVTEESYEASSHAWSIVAV